MGSEKNLVAAPTQLADRYIGDLKVDKDLLLEFFIMFSRFEYALKRTDYVRKGVNWVAPDWPKFAKHIKAKFEETKIVKAVEYLKSKPPQIQMVKNKKFVFEKSPNCGSGVVYLIKCVKIVRNNLFHGGKFPSGPVDDPARNRDLIQYSLEFLHYMLTLDEEVEVAFKEHN